MTETLCPGCVYYPPNLPAHAYAGEDWDALQAKTCAYDCVPGSSCCETYRKTSCSIVDMEQLKQRGST